MRQKAKIELGIDQELDMAYCDETEAQGSMDRLLLPQLFIRSSCGPEIPSEDNDLFERVLLSGDFGLLRPDPRL